MRNDASAIFSGNVFIMAAQNLWIALIAIACIDLQVMPNKKEFLIMYYCSY